MCNITYNKDKTYIFIFEFEFHFYHTKDNNKICYQLRNNETE